jgi:hypothetical protein
MSGLKSFFARLGIIGELLGFLWNNKKWWMIPIVIILLIFGILLLIPGGSAIFPFLYPFF